MKRPKRTALDDRIAGALKSGVRERAVPAAVRYQLLRSASDGVMPAPQLSGQRTPPNWITPSNARRMEDEHYSVQEQKYGYMLTTANVRLAW